MNLRRRRIGAVVTILVVLTAAIAYLWLTQEVTYLAASSTTKGVVGAVTWNTTVFGMVDAHLVVKDFYGSTLYRTNLLKNRDDFFDIADEFRGIEIADDGVRLHVKRNHYKGPDRFPLPVRGAH